MNPTSPARLIASAFVLLATSAAVTTSANAVSGNVRQACMSDYFAYCSSHAVGSASLRSCMRSNGPKLSSRCLNALISAGEVSQATVAKRRSASAN